MEAKPLGRVSLQCHTVKHTLMLGEGQGQQLASLSCVYLLEDGDNIYS